MQNGVSNICVTDGQKGHLLSLPSFCVMLFTVNRIYFCLPIRRLFVGLSLNEFRLVFYLQGSLKGLPKV